MAFVGINISGAVDALGMLFVHEMYGVAIKTPKGQ